MISTTRPVIAALVGFFLHVIAMALGYGYDVGYASIAGVAVLLAIVVGMWGASGSSARAARASLALGVLSFLLLAGWWSGFPTVLGVAAIELALEARLRHDDRSLPSTVGLIAGSIAVPTSMVLCLIG
jgi:hypothetical protein